MLRIAMRGLLARKLRTILTSIAIVLGVAMVSGTFVLTDQITTAFDEIFEESTRGVDVIVTKPAAVEEEGGFDRFEPFPDSVVATVAALPGVRVANGSVEASGSLVIDGEVKGPTGGAPNLVFSMPDEAFNPNRLKEGRFPEGSGEVAINTDYASDADIAVGQQAQLTTREGLQPVTVVGTFTFGSVGSIGGATLITLPLADAQQWYDRVGQVSTVNVAGDEGTTPESLRREVERAVGAGFKVQTRDENIAEQSQDTSDAINGFLGPALLAFAAVALFVGAFIIFNTFTITVAQRAREFGMLRTLGATRRQVLTSVIAEALLLGIVASLIGLVGGLGFAWLIGKIFDAIGFGIPATGLPIEPRTIVAALAVGVLVTLLAALIPAVRATRVPPIAALREGATLPRGRFARYSPFVALFLALVGVLLLVNGVTGSGAVSQRLIGMGIGALLIFVAVAMLARFLVPPFARAIGAPMEAISKAPGGLARHNAMRNPRRTATTAAALMIGIGLVTFVAVFAQGLKASFTDAVESRLAPSDVIILPQTFQSGGTIPIGAADVIGGVDGIAAVGALETETVKYDDGSTGFPTGVDPAVIGEVYDFDWVEGDDSLLEQMTDENGLFEQEFAREAGVGVGDSFGFTGPSGEHFEVEVLGIYKDTNLANEILVTSNLMGRIATDPALFLVLAKADDGTSPDDAATAIEDALKATYPDVKVQTLSEYTAFIGDQVNQILAILYALLGFSVVISLFGIVNTLVLSIFERTREIGMLRAIGTTRRQVRRMVRYESIITAIIGGVLGVVVGVFFGWIVTKGLEDEGLAFSLPIGQLIIFLIVAGIAGVLAAILPARRAARLDVLQALHYE